MPEVAIIMRTRDRRLLLARALASVQAQSFPDWHLVVVNDGGSPADVETSVAASRMDLRRVTIRHHPSSLGMQAAANDGVTHSDSRYVVLHDDDDTWAPEFLTATTRFLASPPRGTRGVITHCQRLLEKIVKDAVKPVRVLSDTTWLTHVSLYRLAGQNLFPPICFLYERAVYDEIAGYRPEAEELGDWDFNLRFLRRYDIGVVPHILAHYRNRHPVPGDPTIGSSALSGDRFRELECRLRNRWLREDLDSGRPGLGLIANQAEAFRALGEGLRRRPRSARNPF